MLKRHLGILSALLFAAGAQAAPIVMIDGGTSAVALTPGSSATITIGITPDAHYVSGYNLIFEVSDTASISLVSCSPQAGVQSSCPAGGLNFTFGAALSADAVSPFTVASFVVKVAAGAAAGATLMLTSASTVTDAGFNDIFVGPLTIASLAVPEPTSAALLAAGLGLALLGRRRLRR